MRKVLLAFGLLALLGIAGPVLAQSAGQADVVNGCGSTNRTYTANTTRPVTVATTGQNCVNAPLQNAVTNLWEQPSGNTDSGVLISGVGSTVDGVSADQTNVNSRGVVCVLDMTSVGTGSVTLVVQGKDSGSGKYYTLLSGAAVTTNVTNSYIVYPGATAAANAAIGAPLPRVWRVKTTANNANPTSYTVGCSVVN